MIENKNSIKNNSGQGNKIYLGKHCSICGSRKNINTLKNFLKADNFDVKDTCNILDIDPFEEICEKCYKFLKKELD